MLRHKNILLFFFALCISGFVQATHIVGGVFSLQHTTGNSYVLTLRVFRDCLNGQADFDNPAPVGIFDKRTHALMDQYDLTLTSTQNLPFVGANCNNSLPSGCTEVGIYTKTISLPTSRYNNADGYYFSYQRCCRNGIIQNIINPGDAGIAIYMEIPSPKFYTNSTPLSTTNPNVLFCEQKLTEYNFNFTDADGDQLVFSMTDPVNGNLTKTNPSEPDPSSGPYSKTTWSGAHSNAQQIIGDPSLGIDANTGKITCSPLQSGTYVIAIKVEEWRSGVKIGEVILELQFTVSQCPQANPIITPKSTSGAFIGNSLDVSIPGSVCIDMESTDATDSIVMELTNVSTDTNILQKPTFTPVMNGFKKITNRICWNAGCELPPNYVLTLKVNVTDNGCPKNGRAAATFTIRTIPMPTVSPVKLLCMTLIDNVETIFYWGDSTGNNPYFSKYYIYRAVNDQPFVLIDSIADKKINRYHDFNTPDYSTNNYRYFLRSVNLCGNLGASSDTLGTFQQLKFIPDQQYLITVTVENNKHIKLIWPKSKELDFAQYLIYKKTRSDKNFTFLHQTSSLTDTSFIDYNVDVSSKSYCYHIVMKDTCDNYGLSGLEACSILLKGNSESFVNKLYWSPYTYWESGTSSYELNVFGNNSVFSKKYIVSAVDTFKIDDDLERAYSQFSYVVTAVQKPNDNSSYSGGYQITADKSYSTSNEVSLPQKPYLFVPNAFTPNDDGLNDNWNIKHLFVEKYNVQVYNKWGQCVFQTQNKNEMWNGKSPGGVIAPCDVYIYVVTYSGRDEIEHSTKGNVTLLR